MKHKKNKPQQEGIVVGTGSPKPKLSFLKIPHITTRQAKILRTMLVILILGFVVFAVKQTVFKPKGTIEPNNSGKPQQELEVEKVKQDGAPQVKPTPGVTG